MEKFATGINIPDPQCWLPKPFSSSVFYVFDGTSMLVFTNVKINTCAGFFHINSGTDKNPHQGTGTEEIVGSLEML
jgi:hypothetical protein